MNNVKPLAIAAAQVASVPGDLAANRRRHLDTIDAARAAGVDVLVFPELSLVGHAAGADTLRLAMSRDDPLLGEIARACGSMCAVVGLIEEAPAAQYYNSAVALRDGGVVAVHRKINLATYGRLEDGKHFAAGHSVDTVAVGAGWRASMMICADLWNPPLVHLAALQGVTVLLVPVSSALEAVGGEFDNPGGWDVNLRFHALTYGLPVAMANRVGREAGLTFWGGSRVLDAFGRTLATADGPGEALVAARIDYEDVRRARYLLPTIRDANTTLLRRELARIARLPHDQNGDGLANRREALTGRPVTTGGESNPRA
jgi:N-carbamoylputrescine amidase